MASDDENEFFCDNCGADNLKIRYHCDKCLNGDFDICQECLNNKGHRCNNLCILLKYVCIEERWYLAGYYVHHRRRYWHEEIKSNRRFEIFCWSFWSFCCSFCSFILGGLRFPGFPGFPGFPIAFELLSSFSLPLAGIDSIPDIRASPNFNVTPL